MNYYCRQLGVTLYNSPVPLAWADRETGELLAPAGDEEADAPAEEPSPAMEPVDKKEKTVWLGFQPPPEDGFSSGLRRRKPKSKKAILRTFGADGF